MYIQSGDGDIPYNYERKIKIILENSQDQKRKVLRNYVSFKSTYLVLTLYTIVNTDIRYERAHDVILSSRMNIKFYYPRVATTPHLDS